ncbi:hypothetical protein I317_04477 [Kwoniella heveanensis CBS 569]|nr:hypothetical protein I317_04477 [Kwoniella heveanensis CBS 569]
MTQEAIGLNFGSSSKASSPSTLGPRNEYLLPRAHSAVDLQRKSSYTRRRYVPHHLPTHLIIHILSFCSPATLCQCLLASRLFFNLAGTVLYKSLELSSTKQMWEILKGSTLLYENTTGKVAVGRRRFKDRLLRHTTEVTLLSHGDEEDEDQAEKKDEDEGTDYFDLKRFSILSLSSSSTRASPRGTPKHSPSPSHASATPAHLLTPSINVMPGDCPPIPLNGVMPRLDTLRIVLQDAYDYHLLFCPRLSKCPLLEGLEVDRLVILGARSPLVVLPVCFPATHRSTPVTPSIMVNSSPQLRSSAELIDENETLSPPGQRPRSATPSIMTGRSGATTRSSYGNKLGSSSGGLPFGLSELTIVMPSGRSYDVKDYEDYHHIFHHRHSVDCLTKFTIVFLSHPQAEASPKPPSATTAHAKAEPISKLKSIFGRSRNNDHNDTYNAAVDCSNDHHDHAQNGNAPWQIAFYDSRPGNPNWTSYLNLAEDLTQAIISVPVETFIEIVGLENLDGELLNMGVGVMRDHRSGSIMQERIRRRIEVRLKAEGRDRDVRRKIGNTTFRDLDDWLGDGGKKDLGEEGMREYYDGGE